MAPEESPPEKSQVVEPARFSDRFIAYMVDFGLFSVGFYLSFIPLVMRFGLGAFPWLWLLWLLGWTGLFVLYAAYFNADERQTLGKRLMGIRVYTAEGTPVPLSKSLLRAAGYIPSSLFLNLGYLWAFFHPRGAAWHDLMAGTLVVEVRPKGRLARVGSLAAAWGLAGLLALAWSWTFLGAPNYASMRQVANARSGLEALANLEEGHRKQTGAYTADLEVLARVYGNRDQLMRGLPQLLDLSSLRLEAGADGYLIEAKALDAKGTVLRLRGPTAKR